MVLQLLVQKFLNLLQVFTLVLRWNGTIKVGHLAQTFGPNSSKSSKTISIAQGSSSLQTVADTLNNVTGVNASVINKGDGTYSLVVRSDTGRNNAIRLTVTENSGDTGLSIRYFFR